MEGLGFHLREEVILATLTHDVIKTSEIEGQKLDTQQVRSSIARRMGIDIAALPQMDRSVDGIVEVMLDATRHYQMLLDQDRLFRWHAALFPTGRSGMQKITVGGWRTDASGPMQVVSGAHGREKIHYEAPPHDRLNAEMTRFLAWLNAGPATDPVLTSALAHFWFVTIHPFDDGNGRIARAIADMILARSENSAQRFYSMSAQIRDEIATDGGLAFAGIEASSHLIGGGDAAVAYNGHRAGTAPQRIRLDRWHEKTSVKGCGGDPKGLSPA